MGRYNFAPQLPKKKRINGRIKDSIEDPHKCLKFFVVKPFPRLEGTIHQMPMKTSVGELRRLVLELSNRSGTTIKDIKLKINHPRFLMVGEQDDLDAEFPLCLEAQQNNKINARCGNGNDSNILINSNNSIFTFPKDIKIEGGSTLLWPLWLHTGEAGNISLSISIYYETEMPSEHMTYRTLRMHYDVQVVPSLDISVHIIPCPSKLQDFLLRLDILNQNTSETFWLRQISCVGMQWKLASLLPSSFDISASDNSNPSALSTAYLSASVCPSQLLPAGQALSLFFKLMDSKSSTSNVLRSFNDCQQFNSDVRLGPPSSSEPLIDIAAGPLSKFHLEERVAQKNSRQSSSYSDASYIQTQQYGTVDLILTAEQQDEAGSRGLDHLTDVRRITSHHICNCSVTSDCPIWWLMEGPKTVIHDFSTLPFCEIKFYLTIRNCSTESISVKIETSDNGLKLGETSETVQASATQTQSGWHDVSLETDDTGKVISDPGQGPSIISSNELSEFQTVGPCFPFMWCALSCANIKELGSWSSFTVPLSISVFAPGIYDLSNYRLMWKLHPDMNGPCSKLEVTSTFSADRFDNFHRPLPNIQDETNRSSANATERIFSGIALGHPFLLTVLQSS
ncbi:hypothetical protein KI387_014023 [Taxus chinensis]|uniref:TPPC8 second Ig-like domain-containing protein n=1 Tax=Taxus chinensis TaxID=29808 RepID=A0AA38FHK2_TAXCH|nr:hypothetical protein KI387_014023 [Taxus chinensis]